MAASFDLSELDGVDLSALRLGAQVMTHKAQLAARPRVESFFKTLQVTVDEELARRKRDPDDKPLVSLAALPLVGDPRSPADADADPVTDPTDDDRRLAADYLDLLQTNIRLSEPVRAAVRSLREQLAPDY
jgi:hypothetical protein